MYKKLVLAIVPLFLSVLHVGAQAIISPQRSSGSSAKKFVPKAKPIRTELSVGYRLNSDGWSFYADKGYVRSNETRLRDQFYNLQILELEFGEHKDRTQHKMKAEDANGSSQGKPFVYGKVNNFYAFKLGYGVRRLIAGKPEPGTVSVHWIGTAGLSLGLIKPYYIEAYAPEGQFGSPLVLQSIKYSQENRDYFLNSGNNYVVGSSGFAKGLGETKIAPGVHLRAGLHFDFAANKKTVLAVETGISAELYFQKIQIMARDEGTASFANVFASIQFGKRK